MSLSRAQMAAAIRKYGRADPSRTRPFEPIPPKPVTLPPTTLREVSDQDIGLPHDPAAQARAERFVRAAIAHRLRQDQAARRLPVTAGDEVVTEPAALPILARKAAVPVRVTVPDESLTLVDPTDTLNDVEEGIVQELRRLTEKPRARWSH